MNIDNQALQDIWNKIIAGTATPEESRYLSERLNEFARGLNEVLKK